MSNEALFTQAGHTLTLIIQKDPTQEHLRQLHGGYLSDLMDAIKAGTIPNREMFRKSIGLSEFRAELLAEIDQVLDNSIIHVDRSIRPSYPDWVKEVMHPELESVRPAEYDISSIEQWLHDDQKDGKCIEGNKIYAHLKDTSDLKNHCGLRDLEEIQKKDIAFFRKYFNRKAVFGWAGIIQDHNGNPFVPYLCEDDDKVVLDWFWADYNWGFNDSALRFAISTKA